MLIIVNGQEIDLNFNNVEELLQHYQVLDKNIVVEKNGQLLNKEEYQQELLKKKDKIEIIALVGGG